MAQSIDADVLVIGGGPGGLAAALYLARFRRRVLVVDEGSSRVAKIPCSHNVPGFPDGIAGPALLERMKAQAAKYGVRFEAGRVDTLRHESNGFFASWPTGRTSASHVVLATGTSDIPPRMPYLADALQQGALRYCPVCDGYEVIDQAVGVIADEGADTFEALYLRHFTPRLTMFLVNEQVRFTEAQSHELDRAGITLVREPVRSIRLWDGRVVVAHGDAETTLDSLYCALGMKVHSSLATALGAAHDSHGYLHIDEHQQTSIERLYAVGDVAQGLNQITVSVGGAAKAAAHIHLALLR